MSANDFPWAEKFSILIRLSLPFILLTLFFVLDVVALQLTAFGGIRPDLTIIAIFYWSIYRPTLLPNWFVFLLGLAMDVVLALPLGLNAFIYLIVSWVISDQRRFFVGQPFSTVLIGFLSVLSVTNAVRWGLFGVLNLYWPPLLPIAGSMALGLFLFPLVNILLNFIHKILPYNARMSGAV